MHDLPRVLTWRKASRSSGTGQDCVETAHLPGKVFIRDSKDHEGPKLQFGSRAFGSLLERVRSGDLDL